jgi:hypothetical protein
MISVKSLVLDATELRKDWLCAGLKFQLLGRMIHQTSISVYVPASVLEEVVAHHGRATEEASKKLETVAKELGSLGLGAVRMESVEFDYREYLAERFDEVLAITVLPWPHISHRELVARVVSRTPPFDQRGSGYRDSIVWASAVELARSGQDVVLVSEDKIFAGQDGKLAQSLKAEIAETRGGIELVRDLGGWLLAQLPWRSANLGEAVAVSRDQEFWEFYISPTCREN